MNSRSKARGDLAALLAGVFCLAVLTLANLAILEKDPFINVDEPWVSDAALHFAEAGYLSPRMFAGKHFNLEGRYVWSINQLLQAAVFKAAGFGVFQARLTSALTGLASLAMLFALGRRLYGARAAMLAVVLFAASPIFSVSRSARAEMTLTLFVLTAAYFFVRGIQQRKTALLVASGVVAGFGCAVHLNGLIIVGALTVSLLLYRTELKWTAPAFAAGLAVAAAWWFLTFGFILTESREPASFRPVFGGLADYATFVAAKARGYFEWFYGGRFHNTTVSGIMIGVSLVALASRRTKSDLLVLTIISIFIAFYLFVAVSTKAAYLAYLFAFLFLATAAAALAHTGTGWQRYARFGLLVIALAWAGIRTVGMVGMAYALRGTSAYDVYTSQLAAHIPNDASVMGQPTWYYGLYPRRYLADRYFSWIAHSPRPEVKSALGATFADAITKAGVQYLIIDSGMYARMLRSPHGFNTLPVEEVDAFLRDGCILVGVVDEAEDGSDARPPAITRIYRVKDR